MTDALAAGSLWRTPEDEVVASWHSTVTIAIIPIVLVVNQTKLAHLAATECLYQAT